MNCVFIIAGAFAGEFTVHDEQCGKRPRNQGVSNVLGGSEAVPGSWPFIVSIFSILHLSN